MDKGSYRGVLRRVATQSVRGTRSSAVANPREADLVKQIRTREEVDAAIERIMSSAGAPVTKSRRVNAVLRHALALRLITGAEHDAVLCEIGLKKEPRSIWNQFLKAFSAEMRRYGRKADLGAFTQEAKVRYNAMTPKEREDFIAEQGVMLPTPPRSSRRK